MDIYYITIDYNEDKYIINYSRTHKIEDRISIIKKELLYENC